MNYLLLFFDYLVFVHCLIIIVVQFTNSLVATSRRSEEKRVSLRRLCHGDHEGSSGGIYSLLFKKGTETEKQVVSLWAGVPQRRSATSLLLLRQRVLF